MNVCVNPSISCRDISVRSQVVDSTTGIAANMDMGIASCIQLNYILLKKMLHGLLYKYMLNCPLRHRLG